MFGREAGKIAVGQEASWWHPWILVIGLGLGKGMCTQWGLASLLSFRGNPVSAANDRQSRLCMGKGVVSFHGQFFCSETLLRELGRRASVLHSLFWL